MDAIGHRRWVIAEGMIPTWSNGPEPEMKSHESVSFLNAADEDAHVELTVFWSDREPTGPYRVTVPARRTEHVRFNQLDDPEPIPAGEEFSTLIESDVPVVAQHAAGLTPGRERADDDDRLPGRLSAGPTPAGRLS